MERPQKRFWHSGELKAEPCHSQPLDLRLHAVLKQLAECESLSEFRLVLQSRVLCSDRAFLPTSSRDDSLGGTCLGTCEDYSALIGAFGSFATLRAVGLYVQRYAPDRSVYIFAAHVEDAVQRAATVLECLREQLALPEPKAGTGCEPRESCESCESCESAQPIDSAAF